MTPLSVLAALLAAPGRPEVVPPRPLPAAEESRRDALARFGVGVMRARDGRPADAARHLQVAARLDPESPEPLRPLVAAYTALGRDPAAIRTARRVLELDPADADTGHALGQLLFDGNKFADAATVLKSAADSPRLDGRPVKRLAVLHDAAKAATRAGDAAGAADALGRAAAIIAEKRDVLSRSGAYPTPADLDQEAADVQEKLGTALLNLGRPADAVAAFIEAVRQSQAPAAAARRDWNLFRALSAAGDPTAASDALWRFLNRGPRSPEPYERLADLLRQAGRGEPAVVQALTRLAGRDRTNPAPAWVLAAAQGRTDPAAAHARFRLLARTATDPALFAVAVRHYRDAGRPAELLALADELFRAARPADPAKPADPAATDRARTLSAAVKADAVAAREVVRAAGAPGISPDLGPDAWNLVAALAERMGQTDAAADALRRAGDAHGWTDDRFHRLYQLLSGRRRWRDALRLCDTAEAPRDGRSHDYYRAVPLAELGRDADALAALGRLQLVAGVRLQRARVLNILGRHREAVAECEEVLTDARTPAMVREVRLALANSLNGLKEFAKSEAELRAALDDDPDDVLVLNNLGYNLADQGRNLPEAEALIRRAIDLDRDERLRRGDPEPDSGQYGDSLGWVRFRRGDLPAARTLLEAAVASADAAPDAVVWDHLGDVAFRQGDAARAAEAWAKAVELYTGSHQGQQNGRRDEARRKLSRVR